MCEVRCATVYYGGDGEIMTKKHKLNVGDVVRIGRKKTTLTHPLSDVEGGWVVKPPIDDISYWNEDAMKLVEEKK